MKIWLHGLLTVLGIVGGVVPLRAGTIVDTCVAVVNEDVITLSEVNEYGKPFFQRVAEEVPPSQLDKALQQARQTVIEKLIEKKLLLQEAAKREITVGDKEVDRALEQILAQNHTSREDFLKELSLMGMSEKQYRENLREQILSSRLINYEVRSKVIIPEEQIIDYYDQHYTEQVGEGGYYILQMGFLFDHNNGEDGLNNGRAAARQRAEKVRAQLLNGADFKELARKYSELPSAADGGDIGVFRENEMADYMRRVVPKLKPGEISEIVETPTGFQIFKLLSSQEGQIITKVPYESAKEEIRQILYKREMERRYREWMQEIRSQAYIKIL